MSELLVFILKTQPSFQNPNRIRSLYDDLTRLQQIEPVGYHANVSAWISALSAAAREGVLPSDPADKDSRSKFLLSSGESLLRSLESRAWGRPQGLKKVVEEGVKSGDLISLDDYLTQKTSIYRKGWFDGVKVPSLWDLAAWGWKQIGFRAGDGEFVTGKFVLKENLEAYTALLLPNLAPTTSSTTTSLIHTPETLAPLLPVPLSNTDMTLLLTYLSRDNPHIGLLPGTSTHPTIIKLSSSAAPSGPIAITQQDIDIATLKSLHTSLLSTIPPLESTVSEHATSAKKYVDSKNLPLARAALRRKALASATLDQRLKSIERVEEMLGKIDQAETNASLLSAMEQASRVLKGINEKIGGTEKVESVLDNWQDVVAEVEEVDEVLRSGTKVEVDEDEVEDEFEALVKEEREREVKKQMEELEEFERQKKAAEAKHEETKEEMKKVNAESVEKKVEEPKTEEPKAEEVETTRKELAEMAI